MSFVHASNVCLSPLTTKVFITVSGVSHTVTALIDSGSAGIFISTALGRQVELPQTPNDRHFKAQSITGKPLNCSKIRFRAGPLLLGVLHQKKISLLVMENSTADIVLGRQWLIQHLPELSWETGEIKKWSDSVILPVFLHFFFIYRKNQERLQCVLPPSRVLLIGYLLTF